MICLGSVLLAIPSLSSATSANPVVLSEFINTVPTTPQCHASTLVDTPEGLVAAWFGGKQERDPGVGIWLARKVNGRWSRAVEVADGLQPDGTRQPSWNPVLFLPRGGPLMLFYKVGPDPQHWWGMLKMSRDDGAHWSAPQRLPAGVLGPIKDKPVQLADGTIVSPSSTELGRWRIHFERSVDHGRTWEASAPIANPGSIEAIQPSVLRWSDGDLQAIGRTRQNRLFTTRSHDGGRNWSALRLLDLPNPNSGVDAVVLRDHRAMLVYNPTHQGNDWWDGRGTLAVAISHDGEHWSKVLVLEHTPHAEFSYPAIIQSSDGMVHIVYTWKRQRIKHVVIDPARL